MHPPIGVCRTDGQSWRAHLRCALCGRPLAVPHPDVDPAAVFVLCPDCRSVVARRAQQPGGSRIVLADDLEDDLLDTNGAAQLLGVEPGSVRRWVRQKRLRAIYLRGRSRNGDRLRFDRRAILALRDDGESSA